MVFRGLFIESFLILRLKIRNNNSFSFFKEAYFTLDGNTYKQIIFNNECDIPYEVLEEQGTLETNIETQDDLSSYQIYNITSIKNNTFGTPHIHLGGK